MAIPMKKPPGDELFVVTGLAAGRDSTRNVTRGQYVSLSYANYPAMKRALDRGDWLSVIRTERSKP